jgi:hypothetical protein
MSKVAVNATACARRRGSTADSSSEVVDMASSTPSASANY